MSDPTPERCVHCVFYYPRNKDWTCELELDPESCDQSRLEAPAQPTPEQQERS